MAAITLAVAFAVSARRARAAAPPLPVLGPVPHFTMTDQLGRSASDETLHGQVLVVDFFYASCTSSCPLLTGKMLALQKGLAGREQQLERPLPVHLVSITLDPANDTPEVLRAYAERVGADGARWSFLSGRSEDLDRVVVQGFKTTFQRADPAAGIASIMHGEWLVLVDASGSLRGFYAASDPERMQALLTDATRLATEDGSPAPVASQATPLAADAAPHAPPAPAAPNTYHAVGVIQSFGPARAYVNIRHEDIPGYMAAMTMSFEPQRAGQLDAFAEKDPVDFDFIETEDARRTIRRIERRH